MAVNPKLLQTLSTFDDLSENQLRTLSGLFSERTVSAGEVIFKEGEPGVDVFVVPHNDIELLFRVGRDALAGIEWAREGDVLGVQAMIPPYRYRSTASSLTDGCLLAMDAVKLRAVCEENGEFATAIHECLMQAMLDRSTGLRSKT